jgi:hypothetical protein
LNSIKSDDSKLIQGKAASLDRPASERDDGNEYPDYWQAAFGQTVFGQAKPWWVPAVPGTYGNSYLAGDE